ncbi:MAG: hemin-degrading factor [Burkholderiaceae bacterium]|nr:hemin-degrading factor [Burkholderiaceae bacterium]
MTTSFNERAEVLRQRYAQLKADQPKARIRKLAQDMGVSELELVAANCGDIQSTLLREPAQEIFKALGELGRVMALTRNEWAVHERHGEYQDIRAGKTMGIVLGPDIDLRMFFSTWKSTWAVNDGGRLSIQFFDAAGQAIHKVYVTDETNVSAYHALVQKFADDTPVWPSITPLDIKQDGSVVDQPDLLRSEWLAMTDTHQFYGLLQRHKVSRLGALRHAGADLAQELPNDVAERMLQDVAAQDISFMCFVGNQGMIQIHSGPIKKLLRMGPWFNVLEPHFNLHLDTTAIVSTWIVNKPTDDGWVTSMECYAENGDLIVQFFGARKPGVPELSAWRDLLVGYCPVPLAA